MAGAWRPEIVETTATAAEGWPSLARRGPPPRPPGASGQLAGPRADRVAQELRRVPLARTEVRVDELVAGEEFSSSVKALVAGELDPYQAADRLLAN